MLLQQLIEQYRTHLATMTKKPLRAATQRNYVQRLRAWSASLPPTATAADITRPALMTYCIELTARVPKLCTQWVSAIRHFCAWLVTAGWLPSNVAAALPRPNPKSPPRKPVPDSVIRKLIAACDQWETTELKRARARAIVCVLAYGGLRTSEVLNLRTCDVDWTEGSLHVRDGKGGKSRTVWICREAVEAIADYHRMRSAATIHDYLFAHSITHGMEAHGIYRILAALREVAGIAAHLTPHQFRHSSATRDAHNNVPLPVIQAKLGHSDITTTARYLHTNEREQRRYAQSNQIPQNPVPDGLTRKAAGPVGAGRRRVALRKRSA